MGLAFATVVTALNDGTETALLIALQRGYTSEEFVGAGEVFHHDIEDSRVVRVVVLIVDFRKQLYMADRALLMTRDDNLKLVFEPSHVRDRLRLLVDHSVCTG